MSNLYCAPGIDNKTTCYSLEDLIYLINAYNRNKTKKYQITYKNKNKKQLWTELNKRLRNDCNNEWCWLERNFVPRNYSKKKIEEKFRPEMPKEWKKNPYEWLSNFDIEKVMKQYEKKYDDFQFMGPYPVDCPIEYNCELSDFTIDEMRNKNKNKLGIIYNLDRHDQPGSHWVAVYLDFEKCKIMYFDSTGSSPPDILVKYLNKLKQECENYYTENLNKKKNINIYVNNTQFQYGTSECGVFSMYFILNNLQGKLIGENNKQKVNDKKMNELRKVFYRPS